MTTNNKHFLILFAIPFVFGCICLYFWFGHLNFVAKQALEGDKTRLEQYTKTIPGLIVDLDNPTVQSYLLESVRNLIDPQWVELVQDDRIVYSSGVQLIDELRPFYVRYFVSLDASLYVPFETSLSSSPYLLRIQPNYDRYFQNRDQGTLLVASLVFVLSLMSALIAWVIAQRRYLKTKSIIEQTSHLDSMGTKQIELDGDDELVELVRSMNECINTSRGNFSSLKTSVKKLENQRDRLDVILSSLSVGVAYLDSKATVLYANRSFSKMCGVSPAQVSRDKMNLVEVLTNADIVDVQRNVLDSLIQETLYVCRTPLDLKLNDDRVLRLKFQMAEGQYNTENGVLLVEDVSVQKNVQNLRLEAETDMLTGLLNRRGFDLAVNQLMSNLVRNESIGLIYLDLDGFKAVNDTLGHKAGDQVLRSIAVILSQAVRSNDAVGRLGGDEFAIVVNRATPVLLNNICQRIISMCAEDSLFERIMANHQLQVSCSLGYALYPTNARSLQELVEAADQAMFEAKKSGKNCYKMSFRQTGYSAVSE